MAASHVAETPPKKFRVGPEKNKYSYILVSTKNNSRDDWIWECEKPADGWAAKPGEVLFIVWQSNQSTSREGAFFAVHAPEGTTKKEDIIATKNWIFSSSEDVHIQGEHTWQWWDVTAFNKTGLMHFDTAILED